MDELKLTDDEATLVDDEIISAEDEAEKRRQERRRIVARRMLRNPSDPTLTAGESEDLVEEALARCLEALESGSSCVILKDDDVDKAIVGVIKEGLNEHDPRVCDKLDDPNASLAPLYFDRDHSALYLTRFALDEIRVAQRVKDLIGSAGHNKEIDSQIEKFKNMRNGFEIKGAQLDALKCVANGGLMVLTGGPGTGKTTVITCMIATLLMLSSQGWLHIEPEDILIAAPTGKAAARVGESIRDEQENLKGVFKNLLNKYNPNPITLHRLLGMRYSSLEDYKYGRDSKLNGKVFIVDEVSMVSLPLMRRFLEAVPDGSTVVLVGDPDQLSSVETGTVLADLVEGIGKFSKDHLVALTESHRSEGAVAELVSAIKDADKDADVPELLKELGKDGISELLKEPGEDDISDPSDEPKNEVNRCESIDDALLKVLAGHYEKVADEKDHGKALAMLGELQLLCTNRHGKLGSEHWNQVIASELGAKKDKDGFGEKPGTPVMITRNNKALGVSNGDVGIVVEKDGSHQVCLPISGGVRYVPRALLADIELAYAITIHKSQGSQYKRVVVQLGEEGNKLNTRELFYTGVSRAKTGVIVVGSEKAIKECVNNEVERASLLAERLGK